jgi:hypothetical protein
MKNIYKISAVLLVSLSIIVSSCKKEDEVVTPTVINGCTDNTMFNYDPTANTDNGTCIPFIYGCTDSTSINYNVLANTEDLSCITAIYGCTDSTASNFNALANTDDGSCVFAYDIAQGIWNISSVCDDLIISIPLVGDFPVPLNDMFPETIEITGEGEGVVSMDINGENVLANVSYTGIVTIQDDQKISIDTGDFGMVDVDITGSGMIESASNGDLTLNLAFTIPLAGTQNSSCEIAFTK